MSRGAKNFVVCFYCNENFRSLTSLLKHGCSAEDKISSNFGSTNDVDLSQDQNHWESLETFSDINVVDLTQVDRKHETVADTNDCEPVQEDSVSSESVPNVSNILDPGQENSISSESISNGSNVCDLGQENSVSSESVSNLSNVCDIGLDNAISSEPLFNASDNCDVNQGNSLSCESLLIADNVCESSLPGTEIECEQPVSESKLNAALPETTHSASNASEEQFLEAIRNVIAEVTKLTSEKLSLEVNLDVLEGASENESSEANSDVVKKVPDLYSDASEKQLSIASSDAEQKMTEVEPSTDCDFNRPSPGLADKILQYYEKQTKQDTPDICASPPTDIVFQSPDSPLPSVGSSSPRQDNTLMECNETNVCKKRLFSDTKCDTDGEDMLQKESDALKHDAKELESHDSIVYSRPSSPEVDSADMFSRSSSIGMDLDSLGCDDDQAESNDSNICSTLPLLEKKSNELKHDHVQAVLHTSKTRGKSLPKQNLNITKYGSVVLKPCYVKVQDIFKSLSNPKVSPKKIFSWKKKYHVCDVCSKFFRLKSDLNIHYLIHSSEKPYSCNRCHKSFMKECNLIAHQLAHTIKRKHKCFVCKKEFSKRSLLLRHEVTHTQEKPFKCDKCSKSYSVKASLTEHYLSHSGKRPFNCELCDASFNNKRYLRRHYNKHQRKESYDCELCFRSFKRKHHLDEHYNIHVNERPNKCTICGKTFHLLLTLNKHYAVAHEDEKESFFQKRIETLVESIVGKDPVIQRIEKSTVVDKGEKIPVKKTEKSTVVDKSEKIPVKKTEKSAVVDKGERTLVKNIDKSFVGDKSKKTVQYSSTRRKSFTPKKYLQPDSFVLY